MKVAQTQGIINAGIADVWDKVCFYEEVKARPGWLLRMALPLPVRTVGDHKTAGTLCRCEYSANQYILKRITKSEHNSALEFSVTEASEQFERYIALKGGCIRLHSLGDGKTLVTMATSYVEKEGSGVLRRMLTVHVVRAMHRFVMKDMARSLLRKTGKSMSDPWGRTPVTRRF